MINQLVQSVQNLFGSRRIRKKPHVISAEEHGINRQNVSPFAITVCQKLQNAGFKAYIVGGAVRDLLIGHTPKDFDVATDATPEQVKRITRRAVIIGRRFRLVHVIRGPETIEVSTFRGLSEEGIEKDENGRVVNDNVFGEQWEDAARRDFTINAMYYDPTTEEILDYHDGMLDVRKKRIRMIGSPEVRYREDPVRILRAVRIAVKLGFKIDSKTSRPIESMQQLLMDVPQARLFDEMLKMLTSGAASKCVNALVEEGINVQLPLLNTLVNSKNSVLVCKSLERCDARVAQGRSISPSFLFAVLFWESLLREFFKLEGHRLSPARRWQQACDIVLSSSDLRGIQRRFHKDMVDIWMLQPRFERRVGASARRLLDHPRFRAAYDFLLIRASSGEISHELADWWTAFESAPEDEKEGMLIDIQQKKHQVAVKESSEVLDEMSKPKKKRRRRRKVSSAVVEKQKTNENIVPAEEPATLSQVESVESRKMVTPKRRTRRNQVSAILASTATRKSES